MTPLQRLAAAVVIFFAGITVGIGATALEANGCEQRSTK